MEHGCGDGHGVHVRRHTWQSDGECLQQWRDRKHRCQPAQLGGYVKGDEHGVHVGIDLDRQALAPRGCRSHSRYALRSFARFYGATAFNQDIRGWATGAVTNMNYM